MKCQCQARFVHFDNDGNLQPHCQNTATVLTDDGFHSCPECLHTVTNEDGSTSTYLIYSPSSPPRKEKSCP